MITLVQLICIIFTRLLSITIKKDFVELFSSMGCGLSVFPKHDESKIIFKQININKIKYN